MARSRMTIAYVYAYCYPANWLLSVISTHSSGYYYGFFGVLRTGHASSWASRLQGPFLGSRV
jgi:hypothetical protein